MNNSYKQLKSDQKRTADFNGDSSLFSEEQLQSCQLHLHCNKKDAFTEALLE